VSEVHKEEEKKEEEKKEVQDPDSSFNSGSYSGEDEFSSIHDLVDKPVTNEKLAHFSTMRVKPSHNFGKTGDSGATKYPKAAMDTNNILHRKVNFSNSSSFKSLCLSPCVKPILEKLISTPTSWERNQNRSSRIFQKLNLIMKNLNAWMTKTKHLN